MVRVFPAFAALALAGIVAANAFAGSVTLGPSEAKRAGITLETLKKARFVPTIGAFGRVLDPAPLLRLRGRIAASEAVVSGANAKLALEERQAARARLLYRQRHNVSAADLQKAEQDLAAAESALSAARARRASLLAQAVARWGRAMAAALREGGEPLPQLAAGKAMLVGLSLRPGKVLALPPAHAAAEDGRLSLRLVGRVPRMLGGFPGTAFLYEASAEPWLAIGMPVTARLVDGAPRHGVVVPEAAVVWRGGNAVVFRAVSKDRFQPVLIATGSPMKGGYFVEARLQPGDRVVMNAAGLLLGAVGQKDPVPSGNRD